jgi:hypothetical protein
MAKSTVLSRFNSSVNAAVRDGRLDRTKHGALIEAARKLAATMDREGWPIIDGRFDNVTPSTYKQYCEMLHLTPDAKNEKPIQGQSIKLVGNSRWGKGAVNE